MGGDRWLHEPSQQWCARSWGFHTLRGGIVGGDYSFRSLLTGVVDIWKALCSEDGIVYTFRNPVASRTPANQR